MKTTELTGAALDWAVAKCEGKELFFSLNPPAHRNHCFSYFPYSTDWSQGGPIIEREGINLDNYAKNPDWGAWVLLPGQAVGDAQAYGCTPLIAAMRCYVASKLGDTIEIPKDLN